MVCKPLVSTVENAMLGGIKPSVSTRLCRYSFNFVHCVIPSIVCLAQKLPGVESGASGSVMIICYDQHQLCIAHNDSVAVKLATERTHHVVFLQNSHSFFLVERFTRILGQVPSMIGSAYRVNPRQWLEQRCGSTCLVHAASHAPHLDHIRVLQQSSPILTLH